MPPLSVPLLPLKVLLVTVNGPALPGWPGYVVGDGAALALGISLAGDAAVITRAVAAEGAVGHGHRASASIGDGAATEKGAIAAEGAVGHGHRARASVGDAAAIVNGG